MAEFAQFKNDQPILEGTQVASKAQGLSMMSELFGKTSQMVAETAAKINVSHSNSTLMNANAQINSVITDAKIKMMQRPHQAEEIKQDVKNSLNIIGDIPLTDKDRAQFDNLKNRTFNSISLDAAKISINQNKKNNSVNFWESFKENMSQHSELLNSGDFKNADNISKNILSTAKSAVLEGLITEGAYENINKTIIAQNQRIHDIHSLIGKDDVSAKDQHIANLDPMSSHDLNTANLSANHITHAITNHHLTKMTNQDLDVAINNLNFNPQVMSSLANLNKTDFAKKSQMILGARIAHGTLNSNPSFIEVSNRTEELSNKSNITSKEQAELNVYKNYMNDLKSGAFWDVMSNSTLGAQAVNKYNSELAIANNYDSYALNPEEAANHKEMMIAEANNNFIDKGVSIAEGSHMDPMLINPIPENIANKAQNSFSVEGNPAELISTISKLKKRNRAYLAKQMKSPIQQQVVHAIGLGSDNNMSPSFSSAFISANKDITDYSALKGEGKTSDATLMTQIQSNTSDIMNYFSLFGGEQAASNISSFSKSALNYVKYRALQNGDLAIENADKYISEFSQEIHHSYDMSERRFGTFNNSQIDLSTAQQDILQNYVYTEAQKNFMGHQEGDLNFEASLSKMDINVVIDSTNHVLAIDDSGNVLFNAPYSDGLMASAMHHNSPITMTEKEKQELELYTRNQALFYQEIGAPIGVDEGSVRQDN